MSKQKFHLFFSAKQAQLCLEYGDSSRTYYETEDSVVVEVTEIINVRDGKPVPASKWNDAQYLGIGTFHHVGSWNVCDQNDPEHWTRP